MAVLALNTKTEDFLAGFDSDEEAVQKAVDEITGYVDSAPLKLPWVEEGHNFISIPNSVECVDNGESVFGFSDHNISELNVVKTIADFYLLDAMASGVLSSHLHDGIKPMSYNWKLLNLMFSAGLAKKRRRNKEKSALDSLMEEALERFTNHVVTAAPKFLAYSHFAIMTEIRYSRQVKRSIYNYRQHIFSPSWKRLLDEAGGADAMRWAAELFRNPKYGTWKGSYGGEPWGIAADVVGMFESGNCNGMAFTEREFLDRVFSLQHNTATFLNKWSWGEDLTDGGGLYYLQTVLNAHNESDWQMLTRFASQNVRTMWGRYLAFAGQELEEGYKSSVKIAYNDAKKPAIVTKNGLTVVKQMTSVYVGRCKTSGKVIDKGTPIVWHGPNKGASLQAEWDKS